MRRGDLYTDEGGQRRLRDPASMRAEWAANYNELRAEMGHATPLPADEAAERWAAQDLPIDVASWMGEPTARAGQGEDEDDVVDLSYLDPWADQILHDADVAREVLANATYAQRRDLLARLGVTVWVSPPAEGEPRTRRDLDVRWARRCIIELRPSDLDGYTLRLGPTGFSEGLRPNQRLEAVNVGTDDIQAGAPERYRPDVYAELRG